MRLNRLSQENFRSIKKHSIKYGDTTSLIGENGVGKTDRYRSLLWLLFGKNPDGESKFTVHPRVNGNLNTDVIPVVEAEIDGTVYKKELHTKTPKNRYWIDGVPKKEKDFNEAIASLIGEDAFRTLTDIYYVTETLHWKECRNLLLGMAGDIAMPDKFNDFIKELKGRSIEDYKKACRDEKGRLKKKADEIPGRIDEIQRGMDDYIDVDKDLQDHRDELQADLAGANKAKSDLLTKEKERQNLLDEMSNLRGNLLARESELRNDTSRVVDLLEEKKALQVKGQEQEQEILGFDNEQLKVDRKIDDIKDQIRSLERRRQELIRDFAKVRDPLPKEKIDDTCPTCQQSLPQELLQDIVVRADRQYESKEAVRMAEMKQIAAKGKQAKADLVELEKELAELQDQSGRINRHRKAAKQKYQIEQDKRSERLLVINDAISNDTKVKPEDDAVWRKINAQINALSPGESMATQIQILEDQARQVREEIANVERTLAQADRLEQDKARIKELKAQEKDLAQKILDVEARIDQADEYVQCESSLVEESVNRLFEYTQWRLFDVKQNGNIDDACIPVYVENGADYKECSDGEKIKLGLDIIKTMSKRQGLSVPLFIDRCESYTGPVDMDCQVIKLIARKGIAELQIEKE